MNNGDEYSERVTRGGSEPAPGYGELRDKLRRQLNPEEIEENEVGAKQSKLNLDCTLVTYPMMAVLAKVLHEGKHYDTPGQAPNWQSISNNDHLNHAINHIFLYLGYGEEEDLHHAYTRMAMAVHIQNCEAT